MRNRVLVPLILMSLVLAACDLKADLFVDLEPDGSGEMTASFLMDDELADFADFDPEEAVEDALDEGWRDARVIEEDDLRGIEATRDFDSGDGLEDDDLLGDGLVEQAEFRIEDDVMTFEGRSPDLAGELGEVGPLIDIDIDIELAIQFPGAVTEHNGDELDGSTVIWRFDENDDARTLQATSEIGGFPWLPVAVVAVVLIGGVGLALMRRRSSTDAVV